MMTKEQTLSPQETILQLTMGFAVTQAIFAVVKLGVPDLIQDEPQPVTELARATKTDSQTLYRFMRALSGLGIFEELFDRHFQHTPLSQCLRTNVPGTLRDFMLLRENSYACWQDVLHTLRTGEDTHTQVYGMEFSKLLEQETDLGAIFNRSMMQVAARQNKAILTAYDFARCEMVVDVAGGWGHRLAAILQKHSTPRGILYEEDASLDKARHHLNEAGVLDRCELIPGDIFKQIPSGGMVYLLDAVHRWDDSKARRVLQNCHQAMNDEAKLLVLERVITDNSPWRIKFADLNMLMTQGGQIRTRSEYQQLFESAGLRLARVIPTQSPIMILECTL